MQNSCQKSFNCLLSRYFAYKALSRLKMPLKIVHQQSTEADQNEQKYQQLLLRSEISLFKKDMYNGDV